MGLFGKKKNSELDELFDSAIEFDAKGDLKNAFSIYQKIVEKDPNYYPAHHFAGVILGKMGDHENAIRCYLNCTMMDDPNFGRFKKIPNY